MEISVSIKLDAFQGDFNTVADITIKSLPVNNSRLVGKQIEQLIFEHLQSALRLHSRIEYKNETLKDFQEYSPV